MVNDLLQYFQKENLSLEESQIGHHPDEVLWHIILKKDGIPFSAGFHASKQIARKIAFAEFLERKKFIEISSCASNVKINWGLNRINTGCGFAAGFDRDSTVMRSIEEAVERWTLSKWIDDHYCIPKVTPENVLDQNSSWLVDIFESVDFYQKEVALLLNDKIIYFYINIVLCYTKLGVFPGYSCRISKTLGWKHCLVEAFRHYRITQMPCETPNKFPYNKIFYFSENASNTKKQLILNVKNNWPSPKIIFHKVEFFEAENFFLSRTIIDGWKSWNEGPIDRFLF